MKLIGKQTNILTLRKISNLFQTASFEVDELLAMVMDAAKDIVGAKNASLLLVQDEKTLKLQSHRKQKQLFQYIFMGIQQTWILSTK